MKLREPFNGASHLVGLVLACAGTGALVRGADGAWQVTAFAVYGASLILLYGISFLYHSLPVTGRSLRTLMALEIRAPEVAEADRIVTPEALRFLELLARHFSGRRKALLRRRQEVHQSIRAGSLPDFKETTKEIRERS